MSRRFPPVELVNDIPSEQSLHWIRDVYIVAFKASSSSEFVNLSKNISSLVNRCAMENWRIKTCYPRVTVCYPETPETAKLVQLMNVRAGFERRENYLLPVDIDCKTLIPLFSHSLYLISFSVFMTFFPYVFFSSSLVNISAIIISLHTRLFHWFSYLKIFFEIHISDDY